MLDKRTAALLQTINRSCGEGKYRIFTNEDFLSEVRARPLSKPCGKEGANASNASNASNGTNGANASNASNGATEIAAMVEYLSENGYIEVKYADSGMFCVRPLPLGRSYCKREKERLAEGKIWLKYLMATAFFGGLVGGLSGALIVLAALLLAR